jgi:hypothetical protein
MIAAVRCLIHIHERLVGRIVERDESAHAEDPSKPGGRTPGRDGVDDRALLQQVPRLAVVAQTELIGNAAIERVFGANGQIDDQRPGIHADAVDVAEVVHLLRLESFLQCRELLLRGEGDGAEGQRDREPREAVQCPTSRMPYCISRRSKTATTSPL